MQKKIIVLFIILFALGACKKKLTPKPRAYFRIDLPEKEYQKLNNPYPFSFEYPKYAKIQEDKEHVAEPYWMNMKFVDNHAQLHFSYKAIDNNLFELSEDSREFAYKHSIRASSIDEKIFMNPNARVYGTIYEIKGNAASPMQFYITDSINHFLRASLYIEEIPNYDSLQPVINFIQEDIYHIIETFSWKENALN